MSLNTIKKSIGAGAVGMSMIATQAFAQSAQTQLNNAVKSVTPVGTSTLTLQNYIQIIINVLIGLIGVVAVIMLIVGGLRYVLSAGEEKNTKAAKDTILFAVIGIVVAILAFAIVNFVISSLGGPK